MEMTGKLFEGKDYPTQWALNPSTYQNMSNDQVDWAALAQQWIKMKETVVPPAPPPPSIDTGQSDNDGGGEAPMDMDTKDDDIPPAPPAPSISGSDYYVMMRGNDRSKEKQIFHKKSHKNNSDGWNQWNQWGHWNASGPGPGNWEWSGVPPPGVTIGPDGKPTGISNTPVAPAAPQISGNFNVPPPSASSPYVYNSVTNAQTYNQVSSYWSGDQSGVMSSQPPPFLKGMRHSNRMPPIRGVDPMRSREEREPTPEEDQYTLDAAKRRQLPAWIREGLEKMEREKQKAVERERQEELRKQEIEARKKAEDEARAVLNPSKSKFDSDSEKETEEETGSRQDETEKNHDRSPDHGRPRRSRFRDAESPDSRSAKEGSPISNFTPSIPKRSREEILQDVMLKVRRSLTEILLEVTNEEISSVCREVWSRARAKAPAGEPPVASFNNTAPLAQITRKLGLGIYGDSNSESEEEQKEDEEPEDEDSDEELKETLRRRQQAFKKTEEEIEARLAEEEQEMKRQEEHIYEQQKNHIGNSSGRNSVENETINNEREASETMSSGGQTPQHQLITTDNTSKINSPIKSAGTESSSDDDDDDDDDSSTETSQSSTRKIKRSRKERDDRKQKSKSRSKSRNRRSRSRSSDHYRRRKSRSRSRKGYRSRSLSSYRSGRKQRSRSRNRKRDRSRSKSRYRSRSHSIGRRYSRSQSRGKRRSRSHSRSRRRSPSYLSNRRSNSRSRERRRSLSRSRDRRRSRTRSKERRRSPYSSRIKRRTRSRSRDRRRSRSKSRHTGHRDGKKSSHRYKD
ncbi:arginine/serine-rich protein PNISR isoform X2 [Leptopilina boulardi]|uniref:arginine/serine-rich protein PNISR isoform X2 n=1 Tax=Leptopilina boulardi TaxID=63433 RepID=UPI0021F5A2AC|nr:arginine/serine-rich protein PNISR isoform X2 [Leptopilina boulardi]